MKIRTDFVTNSSSSSFILTFNVKTKDSDEWNSFEINDNKEWLIQVIGGESSPKKLAECDTVREMFKKFHDETYTDGYTLEEIFNPEELDEDDEDYEDFVDIEGYEEALAKGDFFKFADSELEKVNDFVKKHGEKKVSEYITDIGVFGHEYAMFNTTYQDTRYTYNLETSEYVREITGNDEVISEDHLNYISVPDEDEVTKFIEEYDEEDDDEYEDEE